MRMFFTENRKAKRVKNQTSNKITGGVVINSGLYYSIFSDFYYDTEPDELFVNSSQYTGDKIVRRDSKRPSKTLKL